MGKGLGIAFDAFVLFALEYSSYFVSSNVVRAVMTSSISIAFS